MPTIMETVQRKVEWKITKYQNDQDFKDDKPYEVNKFEGNVLLNEGIAILQTLLAGTGGTAWSNGAAYLGVGDSSTAEDPTDTGLIAAVNKLWKAMEATYPSISGQVTTYRSIFASGDANYAWEEFTVVNASSDAGDNLNRKTSSQGTKTAGQTWTLDLAITWS